MTDCGERRYRIEVDYIDQGKRHQAQPNSSHPGLLQRLTHLEAGFAALQAIFKGALRVIVLESCCKKIHKVDPASGISFRPIIIWERTPERLQFLGDLHSIEHRFIYIGAYWAARGEMPSISDGEGNEEADEDQEGWELPND